MISQCSMPDVVVAVYTYEILSGCMYVHIRIWNLVTELRLHANVRQLESCSQRQVTHSCSISYTTTAIYVV